MSGSDASDRDNDLQPPEAGATGTTTSREDSAAASSCSSPELARLSLQEGRASPASDRLPFGVQAEDVARTSCGGGDEAALLPLTSLTSNGVQPACGALGRHDKCVFVFSTAGKPIFSHPGNEEELAELMATAEAIMSVSQSQGQSLRYLRSGRHVIAFLDRSPLCLLAASALAEPPAVLRMQLALVHGQIISLLTASALAAVFKRNPGYDARKLLGGADAMLQSLIESFLLSPAALLGASPSLPMLKGVRAAVAAALQNAVQASGALFGLVVSGGHVVAIVAAQADLRRQPLQQWDVLLLLNFLHANDSFKLAETFSPVCLPIYNPNGHIHAYIQFVDARTSTAIVLLAGGTSPDFHALSAARQEMQSQLESIGALQVVMESSCNHTGSASMLHPSCLPELSGGGPLGSSPLLHLAYKLSRPQLFVMSPFPLAAAVPNLQQDAVVAYSQLRAAMFDHAGEHTAGPLQRLRYDARQGFVVMASCGVESELYLLLDPLTDKETALRVCSKLHGWLQSRHDELFQMS